MPRAESFLSDSDSTIEFFNSRGNNGTPRIQLDCEDIELFIRLFELPLNEPVNGLMDTSDESFIFLNIGVQFLDLSLRVGDCRISLSNTRGMMSRVTLERVEAVVDAFNDLIDLRTMLGSQLWKSCLSLSSVVEQVLIS